MKTGFDAYVSTSRRTGLRAFQQTRENVTTPVTRGGSQTLAACCILLTTRTLVSPTALGYNDEWRAMTRLRIDRPTTAAFYGWCLIFVRCDVHPLKMRCTLKVLHEAGADQDRGWRPNRYHRCSLTPVAAGPSTPPTPVPCLPPNLWRIWLDVSPTNC